MWFRVDVGFFEHPKVTKLRSDPTLYAKAVTLWLAGAAYCTRQLTDGKLPKSALRLLVPFRNTKVCRALCEAGLWIDHDDHYTFHDWHEYQYTAEEQRFQKRELSRKRSASGRKGAHARWDRMAKVMANRMANANSGANGKGMASAIDGKMANGWLHNITEQDITIDQRQLRRDSTSDPPERETSKPESERKPIREVFEHWVASHGKRIGTKLDQKRKAKIRARLREGFTVEQLKQAIDGCKLSEFHMANPNYSSLETILRDAGTTESHVERLSTTAPDGRRKPAFEVPEEVHVFAAQRLSKDKSRYLKQPDPHSDVWVMQEIGSKKQEPTDWTTAKVLEAWEKAQEKGENYGWLTQ